MKTNWISACLFAALVLFSSVVFSQTKGFIYKQATNASIRTVLDPNGDGYTSKTTAGFVTTTDYGDSSELATVSLPVLFGESYGDLSTGASGGHTDLVSNTASSTHSVSVVVKTVNSVQYLIIRFRIGKASTASKGYSLLIDADNSFGTYLTSNNPGYDREIIMETGNPGNIKIYKHATIADGGAGQELATYNADEYSQRSIAGTTNNTDEDYFYDFCVPLSAIQADNAVRITAATITSAQSGITGTVSDFNGYGAFTNPYQVMKDITFSFPTGVKFTDIVAGFTFPSLITNPPVITSSLNASSTSVSGTSTENGATIKVYRIRGTDTTLLNPVTTVTVSSNGWSLSSGVSGNLTANDTIIARAQNGSRTLSEISNKVPVASTCYTPAPVITTRASQQKITGLWRDAEGNVPANATTVILKLYRQVGDNSFNYILNATTAVTQYVAADGSFTFNTGMGQSQFNDSSLALTATVNGCESPLSNVSQKTSGNNGTVTAAPTLDTTLIYASTSAARQIGVTNKDVAAGGAKLLLFRNGTQIAISDTNVASNKYHVFSYPTTGNVLRDGDLIYARAQVTGSNYWISNISNITTVQASTTDTTKTPVITIPAAGYYTSGTGKTVSGYVDEASGTYVYLYINGIARDTATTNA